MDRQTDAIALTPLAHTRVGNSVRRPNCLIRTENSVFGDRTTVSLHDRTGWFAQRTTGSLTEPEGSQREQCSETDRLVRTENNVFGDRTTGCLTELAGSLIELAHSHRVQCVWRPNDWFFDRTGWFPQTTRFGNQTTVSLSELAGSVRELVVRSPNIVVCANQPVRSENQS